MNLTIEKAKELLKPMILSGDLLMNRDITYDECINFENRIKAEGFIEGWNQAMDKSVKIIFESVLFEGGHPICTKNPYQLAEEINELKAKVEKWK